jgi:hypothetical protein
LSFEDRVVQASEFHLLAADIVLFVHFSFVAFVVLALFLILLGHMLRWSWVRNPWFRMVHLLSIAFVVVQSWSGMICPLTILEMELRSRAGDAVYLGSFIAHWLGTVLYYQAPAWVFATCYTAFGIAVLISWIWVRPNAFSTTK